MRDAGVRTRRQAMLDRPHIAPLTAFAAKLRGRGSVVPDFDPLDGGVDACILFLFEKPGPMTAEGGKGGSGFISRNNNDATAEATFNFMQQAGIVIWNVIPWWNGTVKVAREELIEGAAGIVDLIGLLPKLRAGVMVGRKATAAQHYLKNTDLALFTSDHPSPRVRARLPERWQAIPSQWARVRPLIDGKEAE
jgi:hypothetical protein